MHRTPAAQRYNRRTRTAAAIYVALVATHLAMSHFFSPPPALAIALSVASALPIIALIALLGLYVRDETDEYVRNQLIISILVASGVILCLSSALGMLQVGGLIGEIPVFLTFVSWCCAWGLSKTWLDWRGRRVTTQS